MYMITITLIGMRSRASCEGQRFLGERAAERLAALRDVWATLLLFAFVSATVWRPVHRDGSRRCGAGGAFLIGLWRRLSRPTSCARC